MVVPPIPRTARIPGTVLRNFEQILSLRFCKRLHVDNDKMCSGVHETPSSHPSQIRIYIYIYIWLFIFYYLSNTEIHRLFTWFVFLCGVPNIRMFQLNHKLIRCFRRLSHFVLWPPIGYGPVLLTASWLRTFSRPMQCPIYLPAVETRRVSFSLYALTVTWLRPPCFQPIVVGHQYIF